MQDGALRAAREGGQKFACIYPKPVAFAPESLQWTKGVNTLWEVLLSDVIVKGKEYVTDREEEALADVFCFKAHTSLLPEPDPTRTGKERMDDLKALRSR